MVTQAFADDVTVTSWGNDLGRIRGDLQRAITRLVEWAASKHLEFSPEKTEAVMFTRRRVEAPRLLLGGRQIVFKKQVKHLGVILDSRLSWTPHIKHVSRRASGLIAQCRRAIGCKWGLSPKAMHWVYLQVVRPVIAYGCAIWCPALHLKTMREHLQKVQRLALVSITAAYPGTPTAGLEVFLNIPPLYMFLVGTAVRSRYRMATLGTWTGIRRGRRTYRSHVDALNEWHSQVPILRNRTDRILPRVNLDHNFVVSIPTREEYTRAPPDLSPLPDSNVIHCYTDGSRLEERAGAGIAIRGMGIEIDAYIPLGNHPTVFQAEIAAITETVMELNSRGLEDSNITIFSDSQAALRALTALKIRDKTVGDCVAALQLAGTRNTVHLKWIPGHAGLEGNELADELAKKGSREHPGDNTPNVPVPFSAIRRGVETWVSELHGELWARLESCRQSKMMCPAPDRRRALDICNLARQDSRRVIQILSGHANLARHNHLMNKRPSPVCEDCKLGEETAFHHVATCPRYSWVRNKHMGHFLLEEADLPRLRIKDLANFLKDAGKLDLYTEPGVH